MAREAGLAVGLAAGRVAVRAVAPVVGLAVARAAARVVVQAVAPVVDRAAVTSKFNRSKQGLSQRAAPVFYSASAAFPCARVIFQAWRLLESNLREFLDGLNMFLWALEPAAHRFEREIGSARSLPIA